MDSLKVIDTANLHHAYLIEDAEGVFEDVQTLLKKDYSGAEIHIREFDSLGIDDSRDLIHLAGMRSLGTQLFIYRARSCTREAQNALLKLFEEPPERTHFFVCLTGARNVLPTLRSRVWVIEPNNIQQESTNGSNFVKVSAGERMKILEEIIKDKDIVAAELLLAEVEKELYEKKNSPVYMRALQHIINVRRVLYDKGASLKMLLESTALVIPH